MDNYLKRAKKMLMFVDNNSLVNKWLQVPGMKLVVSNHKITDSKLNGGDPTYIAGISGQYISEKDGSGDTIEDALADFLRKNGDKWK